MMIMTPMIMTRNKKMRIIYLHFFIPYYLSLWFSVVSSMVLEKIFKNLFTFTLKWIIIAA